ncbi:hypothetical protein PG988_011277 [Apiospora saccharicola]
MACVDLTESSRITQSDNNNGLCHVCQEIDFLSRARLEDTATAEVTTEQPHFRIGCLLRIRAKQFCPGCRLILSAVPKALRPGEMNSEGVALHIDNYALGKGQRGVAEEVALLGYRRRPMECIHSSQMSWEIRITDGYGIRRVGTIVRCKRSQNETRGDRACLIANMEVIRQWIQSCDGGHHICQQRRLYNSPVRLIDVEQQRVVESSLDQRYIALSYVWGSSTAPMLLQNTLSRFSSPYGLQYATTPQTISDAIQLVKNLGERYLWVDSLCIVQDDANDKLEQLPIMGNIYRQAYLVIVAAAGTDAYAGLPGMRDSVRQEGQPTETIEGVPFTVVRPSLNEALKQSTWNTRGWTFQEMTLARRLLVFTEHQMYYSCGTHTLREDTSLERATDASESISPDETLLCRTRIYCHQASEFSRRRFKDDGDVLWAFMGILDLNAARFHTGFIWGLPYERLDATLLWSNIGTCPEVHVRNAQHKLAPETSEDRVKFPSWSWLSSYGGVESKDPCGDSVVSEVHWKKPLRVENEGSSLARSSESIVEYGLLQCTARTAKILLRATRYPENDGLEKNPRPFWVEATMLNRSGDSMGKMLVPDAVFDGGEEQHGEFVLLSSNAEKLYDDTCVEVTDELDCGNIRHIPGCKHINSYNIMLIRWDNGIAYRRGLATIGKDDWARIKTEKKDIILG